jgi:hypothetical protein
MCIVSIYTNLAFFATSNHIYQIIPKSILGEEISQQYIIIIFILEHLILFVIVVLRKLIREK